MTYQATFYWQTAQYARDYRFARVELDMTAEAAASYADYCYLSPGLMAALTDSLGS